MRSRRRRRPRRSNPGRREKLNFAPVIIILALSVGCGYATAKYVVDPVVNYVPQLTAEKDQEIQKEEVIEDDVEVKSAEKITGYALQYGCYSQKSAAETVMATLGIEGLQIMEQNDMYKIVGEVLKTKSEAQKALTKLPDGTKAFVTEIYE